MRLFSLCLMMALLSVSASAGATQVPPLNCPPGGGKITIPLNLDSNRFPAQPYTNEGQYANNIDYVWQVWFNENVELVTFNFSRFETEANYDFLKLTGYGGVVVSMTGNLDNNGANPTISSPTLAVQRSAADQDSFIQLEFLSDFSNGASGWHMSSVTLQCTETNNVGTASSFVSQLHDNVERDGVLIGTQDIRYYSTVQRANSPMLVHIKQDAPGYWNNQDFDLYVGLGAAHNAPSPNGNYDYVSERGTGCIDRTGASGMCEDYVLIPATTADRYVYIGVYSYTGSGGYKLYADNTSTTSITAGFSANYTNFAGKDQTATIEGIVRAMAGGIYQSTDGRLYINRVDLYNNDPNMYCGHSPNTGQCTLAFYGTNVCGGTDVTVGTCASTSGVNCASSNFRCPPRTTNGVTTFEKINDCTAAISMLSGSGAVDVNYEGLVLSHEFGHGYFGFLDEYNLSSQFGYHCGHSIMNGPYVNTQDYCTDANHLRDPLTPDSGAERATSNWHDINACFPSIMHSYVNGTPDPEWHRDSDIWAALTTVVLH